MQVQKISNNTSFQGKLNPNVMTALDKMVKDYGYTCYDGVKIPITIGIKGYSADYGLDEIVKLFKDITKLSHKKTELYAKKIGSYVIDNQPPKDCYSFVIKNSLLPGYEATIFGNQPNNYRRIVTPLGFYQNVGEDTIAMQAADAIAIECEEAIKRKDFSKQPEDFRNRMNVVYEVYNPKKSRYGTTPTVPAYNNAEHAIKKYENFYNKDKGYTDIQMSEKFKPFGLKVREFIDSILGKKP